MKENVEEMLKRRQQVADAYPQKPDFVANVLNNAARTIEVQQLGLIGEHPGIILAELEKTRIELETKGIENPSDLRLRAEFVRSLGSGWISFGKDSLENREIQTYIFFTDMGMGTLAVSGALSEAYDLNITRKNITETQEGAEAIQAIADYAPKPDIISDTRAFLDTTAYLKECARLLKEDPTGTSTLKLVIDRLSIPRELDPYPMPHIPEFTLAGAKIAVKILERVKMLQETGR